MEAFKGLVLFHHPGLCDVIGPMHSADVNDKLLDIFGKTNQYVNVDCHQKTDKLLCSLLRDNHFL